MKNNKKFGLIVAFVMAASVSGQAQKFSKWTVTPRVGFNVSNLVYGKAPGKDSKLGFTGGADVRYQVGAYKLWANDCPNHHPKSLVVTLGYNLHMK